MEAAAAGRLRKAFVPHGRALLSSTHRATPSTDPDAFPTACFSPSPTVCPTFSMHVAAREPDSPTHGARRRAMPRYFFQARYHGKTVVDDIGEEFSTQQEAQAHAAIVAGELSRHDAQESTVTV